MWTDDFKCQKGCTNYHKLFEDWNLYFF